jgi:alkyl hydroperoxide reductase subunit AhpC
MKIIPPLLAALFLFFIHGYSQQAGTTFTIHGVTNPLDSGRMLLIPVNTEDYYPFHGTLEAPVHHGIFSFTDSILYPTSYIIGLKYDSNWKYISSPFFVDSGVQTLICNINNLREIPTITNRTMIELQNDYNPGFASLRSKYNRYDSTLLHYVQKNPGSYIALWKLINQFSAGYEAFYDSVYKAFSESIRQTYTGRVLKHKLDMGRVSCIGCQFPNVKFASIDDLSRKVSLSDRLSKYTLIDIWFCHCTPCIDQFAKYKGIYGRFRNSGFQLIGVSTDSKDQIQNWKRVIDQNLLPWPQYLDENGAVTKELSIISWPSNFLIDEKGVIVQKNISPEALQRFLNAHISSK